MEPREHPGGTKRKSFHHKDIMHEPSTREMDTPAVLDWVGVGFIRLDADLCITDMNNEAASLLGRSRGEITGRIFEQIVPEGVRERLMEEIAAALDKGFTQEREDFFPEPINLWLSYRCKSHQDGLMVILKDITERKQAEEKLQKALRDAEQGRKTLDTVMRYSPMGIILADAPDLNIRSVSRSALEMAGLPPDMSDEKPLNIYIDRWNFHHPDGAKEPGTDELPLVRAVQKGEVILGEEWVLGRPDGTRTPILCTTAPVRDSSGKITGGVIGWQDITDRKRMEEYLRQSDERFHTLADTMPQLVWTANPDGAVDYCNERYKDYRGIHKTPEGFFDWEPVVHEDDVQSTADAWHRSLRTGELYQIDHRIQLSDGTYQWHLSRGFPLRDAQGRIVKWFGTATNIELIKNAEEKVRKLNTELEQTVENRTSDLAETVEMLDRQREVLQTIFDNIPVMLDLYDKEGNITLINREFERLLGWSLEEVRHMDVVAALFPDPDYCKEVREYMMEARPGWKDLEMITRSGERVYGSWSNVRLSDGSYIGIGIDVRERRRMEQDLRRLAKAVEQAGEGILILSPEWIIEYINPVYEVLTGYSQNELIGRRITDLTDYARKSDSREIIKNVTEHGTAWTVSQKRTRKNGEPMDVSLTATPVYSQEGTITNYIVVVRDITREVKLQEQLSQNQKMEAIGTLAGGIAHDLKNILTPIVINTEIALMDIEEDNPARELLEEIMQAARMGTDVVNQIVTFSRRDLKEKKPVGIEGVVREAMEFLRSALPSTIDINQELDAEEAIVLADSTQIKQVMINLGSNAGHAMRKKGGELDVKLTREDLGEDEALRISPDLPAGPYVRITVRDTGAGMDEQTVQRIFEPFFTTKKHGEGSGMGLAVVHGIVKEHKGAITVWSKPGEGSIFTIVLPVLRNHTKK